MPAVIVASVMVFFFGPGMIGIAAHDYLGFHPIAAWIVGIVAFLGVAFSIFAAHPALNLAIGFGVGVIFNAISYWRGPVIAMLGVPWLDAWLTYAMAIGITSAIWGALACFVSFFWQNASEL